MLDLNMPGTSGLDVIAELRRTAPDAAVLVMTMSAVPGDVETALTEGAAGYILKDAPVDEMLAGLEAVGRGTAGVSPQEAAMLVDRLRTSGRETTAKDVELSEIDDIRDPLRRRRAELGA